MARNEMIENYIKRKSKEAIERLAKEECDRAINGARDMGLSELYRLGEPDPFHSFAVPVAGREHGA